MARIEWSRLAPQDVEHVLAIFIYRDNPTAVRIRPSLGDGGIDVLVAVRGGYVIYQIKSFAANLESFHKRQIVTSFQRLLQYSRDHEMTVQTWYLFTPLDPTNPNREWLQEITAEATFPCDWKGLTEAESLASKYPDVIDYYLHDGKDRLASAISELTSVLGLGQSVAEGPSLDPTHVNRRLADLHKLLNSTDPHYSYDFSITSEPPARPSRPRLIGTVETKVDGSYIVWEIVARFNEATAERPVPIELRITTSTDSPLAQSLRDFELYGTPFTAPAGTVSGIANLPGPFARRLDGGSVAVGEASNTDDVVDLRLQLVDPHDREVGSVILKMKRTAGPSGRGLRVYGADQSALMTLELRHQIGTDTSAFTVGYDPTSAEGKNPNEVLPSLQVLAAFHSPNGIRLLPPYGPATGPPASIPADVQAPSVQPLLGIVEALCAIQQHTPIQLQVPDLRLVTREQAGEWLRTARLLRGETLEFEWNGFWASIPAENAHSIPPAQAGVPLKLEQALQTTVGTAVIDLGRMELAMDSGSVDPENAPVAEGDRLRIRFVPFGSKAAHLRRVSGG